MYIVTFLLVNGAKTYRQALTKAADANQGTINDIVQSTTADFGGWRQNKRRSSIYRCNYIEKYKLGRSKLKFVQIKIKS